MDLHVDGISPTVREDVLAEAVHRTRDVVSPDDLVTGCTSTGFAVVTAAGPVLAYALGIRLLSAFAPPYQLAGSMLRVQASIGLAEVSGVGPADVLRQAELARRRAVQLGRDRVEWYDAFLEEQLVRRLDLERELPGAVARGELDLVYQPVLDLADRQPVGAEALLRWRSPVLGTVLPAELLPVAEDLDLVGELEWWVLDRACRQLAGWSSGTRELWMAVNVTIRELTTPTSCSASRRCWPRTGYRRIAWWWRSPSRGSPVTCRPWWPGWPACGRWASVRRWTISAPSTPRWPSSAGCRSTCSRWARSWWARGRTGSCR
ncbi:hypothetical protein GCM10027614_64500 [Micromonospora vulcania]